MCRTERKRFYECFGFFFAFFPAIASPQTLAGPLVIFRRINIFKKKAGPGQMLNLVECDKAGRNAVK
jgi:hypothetical protein